MLELTRRELISSAIAAAGLMATSPISSAAAAKKPIVYWTPELSGDALLRLYQLINKDITGRVALKLHTGEPGGPNILPREWIKQFQRAVPQSTIVESNVLYKSPRQTSEGHRRFSRKTVGTSVRSTSWMKRVHAASRQRRHAPETVPCRQALL